MPLVTQINVLATNLWGNAKPAEIRLSAYNSTDSTLAPDGRAVVCFEKKKTSGESFFVLQSSSSWEKERMSSLTVDALKDYAQRVDAAYQSTEYRRVLKNDNWRKMFQVSQRNVNQIVGTTLTSTPQDTMPCYNCGLVLPLDHMTIDHHKPQAGGEDRAILKVLRNIDARLTHAPGSGGVATAYRTQQFQPLPTKASKGEDESNGSGADYRYTLNPTGMLFLSVAIAASGRDKVARYCMHSMFNLKPYCAKCNIRKSNKITDLSWINTGQ